MIPLVSILTLNWNRKDDVLRTLEGIHSQTYANKELIVVDNGSADNSVQEIAARYPEVRIVALPENLGVEGYNRGMKEARGEYLLLIDNDMDLLQKDTLEQIVSCFQSNPRLGCAALQVRDSTQETLSPNNPKYWEEQGDDERGYPCSAFDGGGAAFRRDVLQQTGYYLAEFFVYHSEVDLSTRIWDSGYEIRYFPRMAVSHRESQVSRNLDLQTYYSTRNYLWYVWLYYPPGRGIWETFHFLQRSFLQNLRKGKPMRSWWKGVWKAAAGWSGVSALRRPARAETIRWMQKLRIMDRQRKEIAR